MDFANDLHDLFYRKLIKEYQQIEYKYTLIPPDFIEFDKLMNELQYNEMEIREMTLLFYLKPRYT
jgi:hypothetical protein